MKLKLTFVILSILLAGCEAKPKNDFFGFTEEDSLTLVTGFLNSRGFSSSAYGTVIDTSLQIEYKKCSQGQAYNSQFNKCDSKASLLSYCNPATNLCNTLTIPFLLKSPDAGASSEAFISCHNDQTGGFSDWRVATATELLKLTAGGRNFLNLHFPNTEFDFYWSANALETDTTGKTARAISFSIDNFGEISQINKETRLFVRCVRNR